MKKEKVIQEVFGSEATLSPSDLLSREFKRAAVGGYNTNDVDDFLERVADAFEQLIQQVRSLKEEIEQQRERLDEYRQMEASLRNALVSTQKFGEDLIESAKREAHLLLEEARMKRTQAQIEASKVPVALSQDILILEQQRHRLRVEMMAILETHRNLLDSLIPLDEMRRPAGIFEVAQPAPAPLEVSGLAEGFSTLQENTAPVVQPAPPDGQDLGVAPDARETEPVPVSASDLEIDE